MSQARHIILATVIHWLPLAVLTVLISGMVYGVVQQDERGSANDPQIQMVTDARNALESGATPESLVPSTKLDISQSLAPYLVIYDANGQMVAASATLHGQDLVPPSGVFQSAAATPMDVITWMPEPNVRSAVVVVHYTGGYVLAGRSLSVVEQRESELEVIVGIICLATLILTFLAVLLTQAIAQRLSPDRRLLG